MNLKPPWTGWRRGAETIASWSPAPLRGELFSAERLQAHAGALAAEHRVDAKPVREPPPLVARLDQNEAILRQYNLSTMAAGEKRQVTPAAEWLLDNAYLLDEQIIMARRHFPKRYSRQLPRLAAGRSAGLPRVYDLALELISHTDGRVGIENVSAFVRAYQSGQELALGELWAVPIMLRLALIENVSRIARGLILSRQGRDLADSWAERMARLVEKAPSDLIIAVSELAQSDPPMTSSFLAELWRRLQALGVPTQLVRHWLDQRLMETGGTLEELIQAESQAQAADQLSVGNSITSLRNVGAADWREFVETLSVVEQTLREDPASTYAGMDFASRDRYRHVVEETARYGRSSESEVARSVLAMARGAFISAVGAMAGEGAPREAHVGYYLVDRGLERLRKHAGVRLPFLARASDKAQQRPLGTYVGSIALLSALATLWSLLPAAGAGLHGWRLALFAALPLMCLSQLAVSFVNWLVTLLLKPRLLPRMDFSDGIPASCRTVVAVPTMLSNSAAIDTMLERIELHYLGNRDPNVRFVLLTDFIDASQQSLLGDEALLRRASEGVAALNEKYKADRPNIFFLLHRPRQWNEKEGVWMGWERKRGKLAQFNALLRGGASGSFSDIVGDVSVLTGARYVITLDSDTQLPRDAARQLTGAIAHPLNRPRFDARQRRVVDGYAILQPRVAVSLPSAGRSWFVRLFAGDAGIDPYTRAVSDVYQDLFAEGSFIGKGIYDVEAFEQAMEGRFPENRILSHDLIESAHARSALLSDVQLYEEHPSRYIADVHRRHRWIRCDWQIAPWLLPRAPGVDARRVQNNLSGLSKWKIFDNLRRSLVPASLTLLLILSWLGAVGPPSFWTVFVVGIVTIPGLLAALASAARPGHETPWMLHLRASREAVARQFGFALFTLVFLPYDALISLDAILRTLGRLLITRRRLLEWRTASDVEDQSETTLASFLRAMWMAPALACAVALCIVVKRPEEIGTAGVVLALWALSPIIAWRISVPIRPLRPELSAAQTTTLKRIARKTWRFFEAFMNAEENWLPPDNYQEHPVAVVASRTSPTNIGLGFLSTLAACDFGYITPGQLLERTARMMQTLDRLERHRGHLYNWYDTRTLKPLLPLYISSVDSGNFAAHLLTFRQGLLELADQPVANCVGLRGLDHTLVVLADAARAANASEAVRQIRAMDDKLRPALAKPPGAPAGLGALLDKLGAMAGELERFAAESRQGELIWWSGALAEACRAQRQELEWLTPWVSMPPMPGALAKSAAEHQPGRLSEVSGMRSVLESFPTLRQAARFEHALLPLVALASERVRLERPNAPELAWLEELRRRVAEAGRRAAQRLRELELLGERCAESVEMDFGFLFDKSRELFSIGFNASDHRMDASYYDLLASEARLTSYLAISQYQVSQEHWFNLGRILVSPGGQPALVSWSGSMFEYLMPQLVMPAYENTLLGATCKAAVERQIEYGRERSVPWGFSESGFNLTDAHLNYQYRAFGAPGLGLKRGLGDDLVVAPYASVLALMVAPAAACANLERLAREGREGPYGFYEAIDYTPSRLRPDQESATVRSWMAHHQGMSLVALAYVMLDKPMQRRFSSDPLFKSTDLLLQERMPKAITPLRPAEIEGAPQHKPDESRKETLRVVTNPSGPAPELHLLSNGRYHVMVTAAGGGYSRWRDLALTRWREDPTRDCWGTFCYLRDLDSGEVWSAAHQPTQRASRVYEAIFTQARAEFRKRFEEIDAHTEICVSPEDDVEVRRITLTNHATRARRIEITTFAEVALNAPAADLSHPAFSKLFVQTEIMPERNALLCARRPRSKNEQTPCFFHFLLKSDHDSGELSYETDRARFVGRGRSAQSPQAFDESGPLSNFHGAPLDPIVAIRRVVQLGAGETATLGALFGIHETREGALALIEKYQDASLTGRAIELAWTHSQVILHQLNITEADAQLFGKLAGTLLYAHRVRRAPGRELQKNNRSQASLWSYGIPGDAPLVLIHLTDATNSEFARIAIQAHAYWRLKGLNAEMVFLTEDDSVYRQSLYDQAAGLVASSSEAALLDRPGGIFVRRLDQIQEGDRALLRAVARVELFDSEGTLAEQANRRTRPDAVIPQLIPSRASEPETTHAHPAPVKLEFSNDCGGFSGDGREYVITLRAGQTTPAPWVNVLANARFGTVVSESGGGYTWADNAHEFRLTPWWNDPLTDVSGEAFYIRDDQSGQVWSPTPGAARGFGAYEIRHGFGYSVFTHTEAGIESELTVFVDSQAPVKFGLLKLRNVSGRPRKISATGYWEWVLGELREKTAMHVITEVDGRSGALLARNAYNGDFSGRVAYADVQVPNREVTCDRAEFLGRNGSAAAPDALRRVKFSGRSGAGFDPCAALKVALELEPGQDRDVVFTLGVGRDFAETQELIHRFREIARVEEALENVRAYWSRTLGAVRIETPEPAVDVLANGWLIYQVMAARMWGRSGFYQSVGAYGFRDQLQDAMALLHAQPAMLRSHLLRAAAHQFAEGDVQHWWHPPTDRGVRTRFSDDFLFLPYTTCRYVLAVNDTGVLDEMIPFLEDRPVKPDEEAYYDLPRRSGASATLYEHCVRAINHGFSVGSHGLPLIGCGDWNDGMNLIGEHGKGESVWLAFFLFDTLTQFAAVARLRKDEAFAQRCLEHASELRRNIEANAWDGDWYRRAYFDDGTPLGSAQNEECQIDSLPQSWAVISGAAEPERARRAMDAVDQRLVRRDARLIQLFDPPFDKSSLNPGYIKGYLPGVRENGGQYTHGAIWTVMAFAMLGDVERAWELLRMLLPVNHPMDVYRVEPYVIAADVYAAPQHVGRGGWTWYTGSAGWMYRLIIEELVGLKLEIDRLRFAPRAPATWKTFAVHYQFRSTLFHITLHGKEGWARVRRIVVDGKTQEGDTLSLVSGKAEVAAEIHFGE